jgi:hypothetical protein
MPKPDPFALHFDLSAFGGIKSIALELAKPERQDDKSNWLLGHSRRSPASITEPKRLLGTTSRFMRGYQFHAIRMMSSITLHRSCLAWTRPWSAAHSR